MDSVLINFDIERRLNYLVEKKKLRKKPKKN